MMNDASDVDSAVKFLEEASRYFENRPTGGEDSAYWANVYNAQRCRNIIKLLLTSSENKV